LEDKMAGEISPKVQTILLLIRLCQASPELMTIKAKSANACRLPAL
jgi:hypothetical protein